MANKITDLQPQKSNANKHTEHGERLLRKSVQTYGLADGITVAANDEAISGSMRIETLADMMPDVKIQIIETYGDTLLVNKRMDIPTPDTKMGRALSVASNQVAKTDLDFDGDLLKEWGNEDKDIKAMFAESEWEEITGEEKPVQDAEPQIDRAAELLEKWQVKTGDLFAVGEHRLICGDCTDAAVVARVMGGERADLLFTSPPYAAQREYEIGDFDWLGLMLGMSERAIENLRDNASILVNLGLVHIDGKVYRYWDEWLDWMDDSGQPLYGWYVWDKLSGLMGDWKGRLAPAHEWIFHFAKQPRRANKTVPTKYAESGVTHYKKDKVGLRDKDGTMKGFTSAGKEVNQTKVIDSVIRCQPQRGGVEGHPAPFSVPFAQALIEVYANTGEVVYEPFCGSGTTLMACENLRRRGRAIEISPAYVAVSLQRMADAFPGIEIRKLE